VFLALTPIDGRKGFNGLYTLVKETLQQEPTSGFFSSSSIEPVPKVAFSGFHAGVGP
jgi:hypothetical protein